MINNNYFKDWDNREFASGTAIMNTSRRLVTQHALLGHTLMSLCIWPRYSIQASDDTHANIVLFLAYTTVSDLKRKVEIINATHKKRTGHPDERTAKFAVLGPDIIMTILDEWEKHKPDHNMAQTHNMYWVRK